MKREKKIKIIIFPGYFLPHIGGLETHVDELSKYLSKNNNINIIIFSPNIPKSKTFEKIHNNVKIIRYPAFDLVSNFPVPKFWLFSFWKLFFSLNKFNPNLIMTRTRFFTNSFLGLLFAKFRFKKIKLIHVEHGSSFVKLENKIKSKVAYYYDITFGKLIFVFADKTIAISEAVHLFIRNNFIRNKEIPIIKRGIDFDLIDLKEIDLKFQEKFEGKIIISFIGRLYKWKGVENMIKGYSFLSKEIKNKTVLLIGGYGEDEGRLKFLAKNEKNIIFLGKVSLGENYSIMKSSDIHLHASYPGGGLSSTLLQYMYCENAIIASPHEGAKEVVDSSCGILMKGNSPKEIKKSIENLVLENFLRYKKNSKKLVLDKHNWDKSIEDYIHIFNELLN